MYTENGYIFFTNDVISLIFSLTPNCFIDCHVGAIRTIYYIALKEDFPWKCESHPKEDDTPTILQLLELDPYSKFVIF